MANKGTSGPPGNKGGSVSGARSAAAASAAKDRNITGKFNKGSQRSSKNKNSKTKAGGPTATAANAPEGSLRVMRKSTWDRLTSSVKMREYNTTSYAKYKASKRKGRTSAKEMKQQ